MPVYKNKDEKIYKIIVRHIEKHFTSTFQFLVEQTYVTMDKFEVLDKNQRQEHPVIHFNSDSFS